ncbi:hypothetical protein LCGC14_3136680, partial [marine sediment metagenome]
EQMAAPPSSATKQPSGLPQVGHSIPRSPIRNNS